MRTTGPVIAFAGRRVDAAGAPKCRFPEEMVASVRERLRDAFQKLQPSGLVCSAAAGSDLLAISVAQELGIPQEIVLSQTAERFRDDSVLDRPGDWGEAYDGAVRRAGEQGRLTALSEASGDTAHLQGNEAILDRAVAIAGGPERVVCLVAWDGRSRGPDDITGAFLNSARRRGIRWKTISTLPAKGSAT